MDTPQSNTIMPSRRYVTAADVDELIKESLCRVKGIEYVPPISLKKKSAPKKPTPILESELNLTVDEKLTYVATGGNIWNPFVSEDNYNDDKGNVSDWLMFLLVVGGMFGALLVVAIGSVI